MTQPSSNLDKILRQVQALLAHADDEGNTPEAQESYRQKAEALMFKYRIDEIQMAANQATQSSNGIHPVWRKIMISRTTSEFSSTYRYMAASALGHVDAKYVIRYELNPADGNHQWAYAEAVGYESDLRYAEVLYTSMHLAFAGKMEPRFNPEISEAENAYNMRSAGMEGRRIAMLIWGDDSKPNRVKARKLFARHAAELGEDPSDLLGRGNSVATFRTSYAEGFEAEMWRRLNRMRLSHGDKEMILASRKEAVLEAFYERFPQYRPGKTDGTALTSNYASTRASCAKCEKAKSGYCRDHQHLKPRAVRYVERSYSAAGYNRGMTAARSVDLGGKGRGRVGGASKGQLH